MYKSGPRNVLENHRPISIFPVVAKVLEEEVHKQLYQYLRQKIIYYIRVSRVFAQRDPYTQH